MSRPQRTAVLLYGLACYAGFLLVYLYTVGFVGDVVVPKTIDTGRTAPRGEAVAVNLLLLVAFALQHSVMARPSFKRRWTRLVPAPVERSTYVLITNVVLVVLFWQWRPIPALVWNVEDPVGRVVLDSLFVCGWLLVVVATALINHFDLFGIRQVWLAFRGRRYCPPTFVTPGAYKMVRHPLYLGWIIAFWATPAMSAGHLMFATVTTAYILAAIRLEERNLVEEHGRPYGEYRRRLPMLVPFTRGLQPLRKRSGGG